MVWYILTLLVVGLFAGAIARLLVPGKSYITVRGTILLGIIGSFIGGLLAYVIFGRGDNGIFQRSGLFGSIVGSVIALIIHRNVVRRLLTNPRSR